MSFLDGLFARDFFRSGVLQRLWPLDVVGSGLELTPNLSTQRLELSADGAASSFPEIVPVATDTLTLDITHRGKILKCTHADGCAITVPDDVFAASDWVQAYGTLDVVTFVEDGSMAIEPSLASRSVNVRVELLFSAASVAILNGDIQL